jgi:hypothetical protein
MTRNHVAVALFALAALIFMGWLLSSLLGGVPTSSLPGTSTVVTMSAWPGFLTGLLIVIGLLMALSVLAVIMGWMTGSVFTWLIMALILLGFGALTVPHTALPSWPSLLTLWLIGLGLLMALAILAVANGWIAGTSFVWFAVVLMLLIFGGLFFSQISITPYMTTSYATTSNFWTAFWVLTIIATVVAMAVAFWKAVPHAGEPKKAIGAWVVLGIGFIILLCTIGDKNFQTRFASGPSTVAMGSTISRPAPGDCKGVWETVRVHDLGTVINWYGQCAVRVDYRGHCVMVKEAGVRDWHPYAFCGAVNERPLPARVSQIRSVHGPFTIQVKLDPR